MNKKRLKLSAKLSLIMGLLVSGAALVCWIMNSTFLSTYYIAKEKRSILEAYELIVEANEDGRLYEPEFAYEYESFINGANLSVLVMDADDEFVVYFGGNIEMLKEQLDDILYSDDDDAIKDLEISENYIIERRIDRRMNEDYIVLLGGLEDGSSVLIRTPFESITRSAQLTTNFFAIVSLFTLALSFFVIIAVSRSISVNISELTILSKRMTNLEFDARYEPKSHTSQEIEELGTHMNEMSEKLEMTIGELKSANYQLMQDIQEKEEIDEMRKEFLSNVSHELKTPLALISGYAEGLKDGVVDDAESLEYYCDVILDESRRMDSMVKQLLTLNHLESGKNTVEMSRFDLTEVVDGLLLRGKPMTEPRRITFFHEHDGPQYVWADPLQSEQVLRNYLTNAIHYLDERREIRISYETRGDNVRVSVFNTGDPIPEDSIDRVWEKLYKVDKARTREYGGSGIGLSIVKAIMDSMGQKCGAINHADGVEFWAEFAKN